ncbi:Acyl_transf_3 domain-containing protein [Caenorhabditis elegans]|uniref:Acyl_transf_3 domain-containing protein n=1 Tax=Caenorhabditis elegans TaxID=6239 RepID=A0A8S4SRX2_CAEEL|nr:Acyl_transf_3 domain-containing protein [Caenorhabditis elegans]CAH2651350.1 Acyl_transf_3 domain-containing protein [Caenorhabditis elegans]
MRVDIQCLRGLAILFVFLYHLFPLTFGNGYLGVDIFFVISGYLMARNLTHMKISKISDIFRFYYRRFRRILPLYYLSVAAITIAVHVCLREFWWDVNRKYSLGSLFLVTNQVVIHDSLNYFQQYLADSTSINLFIHTWSLGVEMQFYLLAPFIFFAIQFLPNTTLKLITALLITSIGMIAYLSINAQFAFNFMFLRLWQFAAGFTALFWRDFQNLSSKSKEPKEPRETQRVFESNDVANCSVAVLFLCLLPTHLGSMWLRPLVTLTAAGLIFMENKSCQILQSPTLTYLGDISYVVYLVHWPVISLLKGSTIQSQVYCVALTLLISVIVHHCFEKQYLQLGIKSVIALILVLIALNASIQYTIRYENFWKQKYLPRLEKIVNQNLAMLPFITAYEPRKDNCVEWDFPGLSNGGFSGYDYCRFPKGRGNLSVMVIGNSYVLNLNEHVRAQFNYNYSDWRSLFIIGCGGFFHGDPSTEIGRYEQKSLLVAKQQVELHKPDVLFIIARYSDTVKEPIWSGETDELLRRMNENLAFYERFVKKIYILAPHPQYPLNFMNSFLDHVTRKPNELETLHLNKVDVDEEWMYARERFQSLKCDKCQVFDLGQEFLDGDRYLTFDRKTKLSYVDNQIHLTGPAVAKCDHVFKKIADEVMGST